MQVNKVLALKKLPQSREQAIKRKEEIVADPNRKYRSVSV